MYNDVERLVLDYGEKMTITGETVDDSLFAKLREHFSEAQIVELTAGIAMENFRSKFNAPLKIQSQGFCPLPAR
ncbi:MAG: alkylhydroperoxidase family enzyme [Gammaproteobacteria bacterium]